VSETERDSEFRMLVMNRRSYVIEAYDPPPTVRIAVNGVEQVSMMFRKDWDRIKDDPDALLAAFGHNLR
jgi:hypothetical protein